MSFLDLEYIFLVFFIAVLIVFVRAVKIVPQQQIWIVERFGKYYSSLESGLHLIIPFVDKISYKHSMKELAMDVPHQAAITKDNVTLTLDGVLYLRIIDAKSASYGVDNVFFALKQLAQTSMRSAIGKITLDNTFEERESLNMQVVSAINEAASTWGVQCMRYEIKDIEPPQSVLKAMEMQVAAERQKRARILESEGQMQATINTAEAEKRQAVLRSEGVKTEKINEAMGQANAIKAIAEAQASAIESVAAAIGTTGGHDAVTLRVAEDYLKAFQGLATNAGTIVVPANSADAGGMIAQALGIYSQAKSNIK